MAQPFSKSVSTLRAVTYRLNTTPAQELPQTASQISASIWNCRDLLFLPSENKQPRETSEVLKRFNTRLSSLLQDRSIEGRWAAVVLVKATIEAGGLEVLSKCNPWVRILLGFLKKSDPPTSRNLTVITLTRIFMLTWDYSNLVREITTPNLTTFVQTCLSNLEHKRCSASEFQTILEAFVTLVPRHPNIFRTNEAKIRTVLSSVLSGTDLHSGAQSHYTASQRATAERLLVLLHHCAPKQGSSEKWNETLKASIRAAHGTCDRIFRAVQEQWQSAAGISSSAPFQQLLNGDVELESEDDAGLKPWKGVYAGAERLVELLHIIEAHLTNANSASATVQVGIVMDLLARIMSITVSSSGKQDTGRFNNQITKDEREAMFSILPKVHVATLDLMTTVFHRFESAALPLVQTALELALPVFRAEGEDAIRQTVFTLVDSIVDRCGLSMSRNDVSDLAPILKAACQILLPDEEAKSGQKTAAGGVKQQLGLSGGQVTQSHPTNRSDVIQAAAKLLCTSLRRLDAGTLSPQLRAHMDRVAVLSRSQDILIASVMNPAKKHNDGRLESSLMPILARDFGKSPDTEALFRPRMPPVRGMKNTSEISNGFDELEEDDEYENGAEEEVDDDEILLSSEDLEMSEPAGDAIKEQMNGTLASADAESGAKRRATDDEQPEVPAKRVRAASLAESLLPEGTQSLPGPDPQIVQTGAPSTIVSSQATFASAVQDQPDIGLDDSDDEMPELNPDPDTDPEDAAEDSD